MAAVVCAQKFAADSALRVEREKDAVGVLSHGVIVFLAASDISCRAQIFLVVGNGLLRAVVSVLRSLGQNRAP